eukprot:SAG11_NODE_431_length_9526_cov_11.297019_3_plen_77_part_00
MANVDRVAADIKAAAEAMRLAEGDVIVKWKVFVSQGTQTSIFDYALNKFIGIGPGKEVRSRKIIDLTEPAAKKSRR